MDFLPKIIVVLSWGVPTWLSFNYLFDYESSESLFTRIMVYVTFFLNNIVAVLLLISSWVKRKIILIRIIKDMLRYYFILLSIYVAYLFSSGCKEYEVLFK